MAKVGVLVKESTVREIAAGVSGHPSFFVATINRLPASDADQLRQELSGAQARMLVIKRRLGRRALEGLNLPGITEEFFACFEGTVGLVLPGDDVLPVAKTLVEFIKAHADQLAVRGGVLDGELLTQQRVEELASLPTKPVLLAQVVGTIEAPISQLIGTLEQLLSDIIYGIDELAKKKPETKAETPPEPTPPETEPTQEGPPS